MKFQRSQVAKIAVLLFFLLVIRFIASSLRPSCLYFLLVNLLIAALAIESGVLRALSEPTTDHDMKPAGVTTPAVSSDQSGKNNNTTITKHEGSNEQQPSEKPAVVVEKTVISAATTRVHKLRRCPSMPKLRRCPSMPSLFFIGNSDHEAQGEEVVEEELAEDVADVSAQELLVRAEMFIANFYKQLKIQREASWNKIHGLYHKPF